MTDPVSWLPDGPMTLDEFRASLSSYLRREPDRSEVNGQLTSLRVNGLINVTGDPRQTDTMVIVKTGLVPRPHGAPIPASRPEFHVTGGASPDLRMDRVEHQLDALSRRVRELEGKVSQSG